MVRREQRSRDQCGVSWISEGDILCKGVSHCEPLHSWLTALRVPAPCLHTASQPLFFPSIASIASAAPAALSTAHSRQRAGTDSPRAPPAFNADDAAAAQPMSSASQPGLRLRAVE
ncbi:hypothetical protein EYF80_044814 [Liparis tanakae]|uniref:Uncharacterized protein n=1 Tax=Liparis tanakae TaxID=230148 RepID=A0A4Z2FV09_9TELE|nr:hypothetical protein EYF80_044814 [Liparis tanakae]